MQDLIMQLLGPCTELMLYVVIGFPAVNSTKTKSNNCCSKYEDLDKDNNIVH